MRRSFVAARFATVGLFNGVEVLVVEPALARSLRHLGLYASARRTATTLKLCPQLTQTACTVLELTAALARRHGNPRRDMLHAHRRVRRVHALSARTRRAKHLYLAIARQLLRPTSRHSAHTHAIPSCSHPYQHLPSYKKCDKGKVPLSHRIPIACVARLGEGDLAGLAVHIGDTGQALDAEAALAELIATALEALLNCNANAGYLGTCSLTES